MGWLERLLARVATIIVGRVASYVVRKITGGVQWVADTVAGWLYDLGYQSLARTVRHFGQFVVWLGKQAVTAVTILGDVTDVVDVYQVVDDVEIDGQRYGLVSSTHFV